MFAVTRKLSPVLKAKVTSSCRQMVSNTFGGECSLSYTFESMFRTFPSISLVWTLEIPVVVIISSYVESKPWRIRLILFLVALFRNHNDACAYCAAPFGTGTISLGISGSGYGSRTCKEIWCRIISTDFVVCGWRWIDCFGHSVLYLQRYSWREQTHDFQTARFGTSIAEVRKRKIIFK